MPNVRVDFAGDALEFIRQEMVKEGFPVDGITDLSEGAFQFSRIQHRRMVVARKNGCLDWLVLLRVAAGLAKIQTASGEFTLTQQCHQLRPCTPSLGSPAAVCPTFAAMPGDRYRQSR